MALNSDQEKTLKEVLHWWKDKKAKYFIIDGAGGTGKTYLVEALLQLLPRCDPIILAPTNEAVNQIREKVKGDYIFKTVDSSLGIAPTTHTEELKFEQMTLPTIWEKVNLAVVDEASMVDEIRLQILIDIGVKIIFLGHKAQLSPVKPKRPKFDPCISPVFEKNWPTSTLTIPMRNTGALWEFNSQLEQLVYNPGGKIPKTFDTKKAEIRNYIHSEEGIEDLFQGSTKIVLWTNYGVDKYNSKIRSVLFGEEVSSHTKFLPRDKIILTKPLTVINQLEKYNEEGIRKVSGGKREEFDNFYANAKAEVLHSTKVVVRFNGFIEIPCHKIFVICEGVSSLFYSPIFDDSLAKLEEFYKHKAWARPKAEDRKKIYREMYFVLSIFASVKHFYAATSYRMQGSTIPNVIVINKDINLCGNAIERAKHLYVACSRTRDKLMLYRGY